MTIEKRNKRTTVTILGSLGVIVTLLSYMTHAVKATYDVAIAIKDEVHKIDETYLMVTRLDSSYASQMQTMNTYQATTIKHFHTNDSEIAVIFRHIKKDEIINETSTIIHHHH